MGRSRVPATLHSELSEYSSLLRALRTTSTLDIATQLTKPRPSTSSQLESINREASPVNNSRKRKRRGGGVDGSSNKPKDYWTRWPLLPSDVHVPEWGLEDEIKLLASQGSKSYNTTGAIDDEEEEEMHCQPFYDALTLSSSIHLSHILSLIAAHVPLTAKSMQDRYSAIGWENVLDLVSASGILNEKTVRNVQGRIEAIHGPSQSRAVHRLRRSAIPRQKLKDSVASYDMSFLSFPDSPDPKKPKKTKAKQTNTNMAKQLDIDNDH